jgi:hypothetical protein
MPKRSPLDVLVTSCALSQLRFLQGSSNIDRAPAEIQDKVLKNVCAKVDSGLSDEIDNVCGFLDCSKREFIEAALIDAVEKANAIIQSEGLQDAVAALSENL